MQVAAESVGPGGTVVGIDLLGMAPLGLPNAVQLEADLGQPEARRELLEALGGAPTTVLSDMAPNLSGVRVTDTERSADLADLALEFAVSTLATGGCFVVKLFPGDRTREYEKRLRGLFGKVVRARPEATRGSSSDRRSPGRFRFGARSGGISDLMMEVSAIGADGEESTLGRGACPTDGTRCTFRFGEEVPAGTQRLRVGVGVPAGLGGCIEVQDIVPLRQDDRGLTS